MLKLQDNQVLHRVNNAECQVFKHSQYFLWSSQTWCRRRDRTHKLLPKLTPNTLWLWIVFSYCCWNFGSPQIEESPSLSILRHLDPKLWKKCNHHIIWPRNVNIWVWRKRTTSESHSSCTNVIVVWIQAFYHQRRRFMICFSWFDFSLKLLLII